MIKDMNCIANSYKLVYDLSFHENVRLTGYYVQKIRGSQNSQVQRSRGQGLISQIQCQNSQGQGQRVMFI